MLDKVITIIAVYLAIGVVMAVIGILIMLGEENDYMRSLKLNKYVRGFIVSVITWPLIVWDIIRMTRHRKEWHDKINEFEDKLKK